MKLTQLLRRASMPPAVCISETHQLPAVHRSVGNGAVWTMPAPSARVRFRAAQSGVGGSAVRQIAGAQVAQYAKAFVAPAAADATFAGDVRGVPPRGRPV